MNLLIIKRLQLAYKVFRLKNFEEYISGYEYAGKVKPYKCDDCENIGKWCMSRCRIRLDIEYNDHFHCCDECKKRVEGQIQEHKELLK